MCQLKCFFYLFGTSNTQHIATLRNVVCWSKDQKFLTLARVSGSKKESDTWLRDRMGYATLTATLVIFAKTSETSRVTGLLESPLTAYFCMVPWSRVENYCFLDPWTTFLRVAPITGQSGKQLKKKRSESTFANGSILCNRRLEAMQLSSNSDGKLLSLSQIDRFASEIAVFMLSNNKKAP